MKYLFFSASFLCLSACGGNEGDGLTPEARAELEAKCAVINKIVAAREDVPAFSSLTPEDVPPGAATCEMVDEFYPAESWLGESELLSKRAYVCTYETSASLDPNSDLRVAFSAESKRVTDCFSKWYKRGIGGMNEDGTVHSAAFQYSPEGAKEGSGLEGEHLAPVSYSWLLASDPKYLLEGQRIVFYVLSK